MDGLARLGITPVGVLAAGPQCSMLLTANGHVYYWGKHRSNAEAVMRPQLVEALANNGHVVTGMAAASASVACCTNMGATVVWGQGSYGEMGLGEDKKSSAKPTFVDALEGRTVCQLACGQGSMIALVEEHSDKPPLPAVDESEIEAALGSVK